MQSAMIIRGSSRVRVSHGQSKIAIESPAPWRRAIAAASTATALGLVGHTAAGGTIDAFAIALAFVPVLALTRLQASRELGWWTFAGMLLLAQVVVHVGASCAPGGLNNSPPMLLAHIGAAALAGLALRRHEARAWAKARTAAVRSWVSALLRRMPTILPLTTDVASCLQETFLLIADDDRAARMPTRRGPPLHTFS